MYLEFLITLKEGLIPFLVLFLLYEIYHGLNKNAGIFSFLSRYQVSYDYTQMKYYLERSSILIGKRFPVLSVTKSVLFFSSAEEAKKNIQFRTPATDLIAICGYLIMLVISCAFLGFIKQVISSYILNAL
jgi:hypothetical protein